MLAEIRDYLKDLGYTAYAGKIPANDQEIIGVYGGSPLAQIESIGQCSSYHVASINVLVHWNKNAIASEQAAREIYNALNLRDVNLSGVHINYSYTPYDGPVSLDTDENGIYEYSIPMTIYYRR